MITLTDFPDKSKSAQIHLRATITNQLVVDLRTMPESRRIRLFVIELINLYSKNKEFSELVNSAMEYKIAQRDFRTCYNKSSNRFDYSAFLILAGGQAKIHRSN